MSAIVSAERILEAAGERKCTSCSEVKDLDEFREDPGCRGGRRPVCRTCENRRPKSPDRILNNRARHRATAILLARHQDEFATIFAEELTRVRAEHEQTIAPEAAARGQHDAATARLKPGKPRKSQSSVVQRLDVARCPQCHDYHDAGHPACVKPPGRARTDLDPVAVDRALEGHPPADLTRAERFEIVRRAKALGWSYRDIRTRTGISKPERYIDRKDQAS